MSDLSWGMVEKKSEDHTVQGSEAWLRWRGKGIGSSDSAVLLGWSPWKTIDQLLEEKLGRWKPTFGWAQQKAMDRGKELEPIIRSWYETNCRNGVKFKEDVEEGSEPYQRASYDGINREFINPEDGSKGRIIEIKAPNAKDHAMAKEGMVTEKYIAQINWLMMVAKVEWCDYVSYGSDDTYAVVPVKANKHIQKELAERAHIFWKHVETKTPLTGFGFERFEIPFQPIDLSKAEVSQAVKEETVKEIIEAPQAVAQIEDQEVEAIVAEAIEAQKLADQAVGKFEALKEKLKIIVGKEEKMQKGQAVFGWQKRKGAVDYSVIPELIGLDLDQFRKPDTKAFYFKKI